MKLKIKDEEYKLNWGLTAFGLAGEELGLNPYEVMDKMMGDSIVANTMTYYALLTGYRIDQDDKFAKLPFGEMKFVEWLEEQPQELANDIVKDFFEFSSHGKTWAERFEIDINKIFPKDEVDKEPKKKISKRTPKSS